MRRIRAKSADQRRMLAYHGDVIRILDHVRAVGIKKVGYQIRAAPKQ